VDDARLAAGSSRDQGGVGVGPVGDLFADQMVPAFSISPGSPLSSLPLQPCRVVLGLAWKLGEKAPRSGRVGDGISVD
jgi:hypothetical protein